MNPVRFVDGWPDHRNKLWKTSFDSGIDSHSDSRTASSSAFSTTARYKSSSSIKTYSSVNSDESLCPKWPWITQHGIDLERLRTRDKEESSSVDENCNFYLESLKYGVKLQRYMDIPELKGAALKDNDSDDEDEAFNEYQDDEVQFDSEEYDTDEEEAEEYETRKKRLRKAFAKYHHESVETELSKSFFGLKVADYEGEASEESSEKGSGAVGAVGNRKDYEEAINYLDTVLDNEEQCRQDSRSVYMFYDPDSIKRCYSSESIYESFA